MSKETILGYTLLAVAKHMRECAIELRKVRPHSSDAAMLEHFADELVRPLGAVCVEVTAIKDALKAYEVTP